MILFPAIDLKDGQAVRLKLGDMAQATVFNTDPAAQAQALRGAGLRVSARRRSRRRLCRREPQRRRRSRRSSRRCRCRCSSAAASARWRRSRPGWHKGLARVILGTVALRDPELVKAAAKRFPGQVAVGIDARGGKVAVEGWAETSELDVARNGAALRGRRRRSDHLHRHRARRRARRHQLGRNARARARHQRCRSSPRAGSPRWPTSSG